VRERMGLILKIACYVLAALLLYELRWTVPRLNSLSRVKIPALPVLDSETNSLAGAPISGTARTGTNSSAIGAPIASGLPVRLAPATTASARTNSADTNSPATNAFVAKKSKETGTNLTAATVGNSDATNFTVPLPYPEEDLAKSVAMESITNAPTNSSQKVEMAEQNRVPVVPAANVPTEASTNTAANPPTAIMGTNAPLIAKAMGTNSAGTNASSKTKKTNSTSSGAAMAAMNMSSAMMRGGGGGGKSDLPPEIKARVDKIYESELFGQIMRPQPMALQGIAGNSAFLRAPSGQTGLVKEGDTLGEIKLLRIGINRVLVEQDGQKSELTIFNGYGGESLMPKDKETPK